MNQTVSPKPTVPKTSALPPKTSTKKTYQPPVTSKPPPPKPTSYIPDPDPTTDDRPVPPTYSKPPPTIVSSSYERSSTEESFSSYIESTGPPVTSVILSTDPFNQQIVTLTSVSTPIYYQTILYPRKTVANSPGSATPALSLGNAPIIAGVIFGVIGLCVLCLIAFIFRSRRQMKKNTSDPIPFLATETLDQSSLHQPHRNYKVPGSYPASQFPGMDYRQSPELAYASMERDQLLPAGTGVALPRQAYPTPSYILTNGNLGIAYSSDGTPLFSVPMDEMSPVSMMPPGSDLEANQPNPI
jgi:hypothetical protein